ncbi:MAG TPA: hypothetical protein PKN88_09600, partial [Bacillota bacterium]|nr:hypothetical protein [Bacillota bacterium]
KVKVNGKDAGFSELAEGMAVKISYRADVALKINAQHVVTEVEGVITSVDTRRGNVTVAVGSRSYTYSLGDADIYVEGKRARIGDLVVGMTAELQIINGSDVSEINAYLEKVQGVVVELDEDDMEITLRLYSTNVTYHLDEDVRAEMDGKRIRLGTIERGDQVELEFEDGLVVLIKVK